MSADHDPAPSQEVAKHSIGTAQTGRAVRCPGYDRGRADWILYCKSSTGSGLDERSYRAATLAARNTVWGSRDRRGKESLTGPVVLSDDTVRRDSVSVYLVPANGPVTARLDTQRIPRSFENSSESGRIGAGRTSRMFGGRPQALYLVGGERGGLGHGRVGVGLGYQSQDGGGHPDLSLVICG